VPALGTGQRGRLGLGAFREALAFVDHRTIVAGFRVRL
jgi:hypothetical protein